MRAGGSIEAACESVRSRERFALLHPYDVELDALSDVERLVSVALDVGEVNEHVVTGCAGDEAEALLGIEELHSTCSQFIFSLCVELIRLTDS
jgi:hypothetical protein